MAPIAKKTYSKKGVDLQGSEHEKENVDPFDQLLSSPLKQEVQFKPLDFFSKKLKESEKSAHNKFELFELSGSDRSYFQSDRKKKVKRKALESRSYEKDIKSVSSKTFSNNNNNTSSFDTFNHLKNCATSPGSNAKVISTSVREDDFKFVTLRSRFKEANATKYNPFIWNDISILESPTSTDTIKPSPKKCEVKKDEVKNFDMTEKKGDGIELNIENLDAISFSSSIGYSILSSTKINDEFCSQKTNSPRKFFQQNRNISREDGSCFENSVTLKYKEKWLYSMSLLKMLQSKNSFNTGSKSKKFQTLVQNETEVDNDKDLIDTSILSTTLTDSTLKNISQNTSDEKSGIFQSTIKPADNSITKVDVEDRNSQSDSIDLREVSTLASMMSDMTIESEGLMTDIACNNAFKTSDDNSRTALDNKKNSSKFSMPTRNVAMRRGFSNRYKEKVITDKCTGKTGKTYNSKKSEGQQKNKNYESVKDQNELEKTLDLSEVKEESNFRAFALCSKGKDRMSLDSSRLSTWACPIFESTRIHDDDHNGKESFQQNVSHDKVENTWHQSENVVALKSGKKWRRSMSVLKKLQNGRSILDDHETTRLRGRNFDTFVKELKEMQEQIFMSSASYNSTLTNETIADNKVKNKQYETYIDKPSNFLSSSEVEDEDSINFTIASEAQENSLTLTDSFRLVENSRFASVMSNTRNSCKTLMNYTVKVIEDEISNEKPSAFRSALGIVKDATLFEETKIHEDSEITAKDFILLQCGQEEVLPFEQYFNERTLKNCRKIGEGVYGEVFMCNSDTVLKIIPIEGEDKVNGEPQKKFEEILSEVVIASKLSNLRKGEKYQTSGFSEMKRCWCVIGKYPKFLIDLWNEYDKSGNGSENDSPVMFKSDQLYIILELANGGKDLESFVFNSSEQSLSIFIQALKGTGSISCCLGVMTRSILFNDTKLDFTEALKCNRFGNIWSKNEAAFSLAAAEKALEFEHRDLHWGNLLIDRTKKKFMKVILDGVEYEIPTKGVQVSIIDFTLSRMSHEGCCIFNDLSVDPSLFASHGDYQFEIYRMMQREVKNDWSVFRPRNNLYWLHYVLDKMVKMVRYKNKNTAVHKKFMKEIKLLESVILEHEDSMDFVLGQKLV